MIASRAGRNKAGLAALLLALLSVGLTVVVEREGFARLDGAVLSWVRSTRTAPLASFMLVVSHLSSEYATPVVILLSTLLMARRSRFWPRYFLAMAMTSTVWQIWLKHLLQRPRPQPPFVPFWSGAGYPSGHALTALCIALAWLLWLRLHDVRLRPPGLAAIQAALMLWPLLVGFSRIYIDAHWTSDILGGFALGAMHFLGSVYIAGKGLAIGHSPHVPGAT